MTLYSLFIKLYSIVVNICTIKNVDGAQFTVIIENHYVYNLFIFFIENQH